MLIKKTIATLLTVFCLCLLGYADLALAEDRFKCYTPGVSGCTSALSESEDCRINYDYRIEVTDGAEDLVILSIHGGLIEPYTSEVAATIAASLDGKHYDFFAHATESCRGGCVETNSEPKLAIGNFSSLHITSTKFNEEQALKLVGANSKAVSIHGYSPRRDYDMGQICVGGARYLNGGEEVDGEPVPNEQVTKFVNYINNNREDLPLNATDAREAQEGELCGKIQRSNGRTFQALSGKSLNNITNKNPQKAGLQLEFNYDLLENLANMGDRQYDSYRQTIERAIEQAVM